MYQVVVLEPQRRNSTRQKVITTKKFPSEEQAWAFYEEMEQQHESRYEIEFRALDYLSEKKVA